MTPELVAEAAERIGGHIRRTPTIEYSNMVLKLELLQHTGSFKPRGAFNKVLQSEVPKAGLVAASGGNHGLAVAYVARQLGYRAEIFVPTISSPVKVQRLKSLGAEVTVVGDRYSEALIEAQQRQADTGALSVHAYNDPVVVSGQGTMAYELDRQAPALDTVLIAVGGGGLIAGAAALFGGRVRIVAVETDHTNAYRAAITAGEPVSLDSVGGPAADSLGATSIGEIPWQVLASSDVPSVVVSDEDVARAQRALWDDLHLLAEPGGATALAAIVAGAYVPASGERVGVVVCGSNVDPHTIVD